MAEKVFAGSKWRGRFFAYAPLVLWTAVILILGSGPGSMTQTSRFIGPLIEFFFPDASPETVLLIHAFIRKTAHFVEYFILAVLAVRTFSTSGEGLFSKYRYLAAVLLVLIVAGVDEVNQSFYAARTSSPWDVLLDLVGGLFGTGLAWLWLRRHSVSTENTG